MTEAHPLKPIGHGGQVTQPRNCNLNKNIVSIPSIIFHSSQFINTDSLQSMDISYSSQGILFIIFKTQTLTYSRLDLSLKNVILKVADISASTHMK